MKQQAWLTNPGFRKCRSTSNTSNVFKSTLRQKDSSSDNYGLVS